MIRRVWFREFRALRDVDVTLEPLTVIVGPNGSGKTSILEGIELALSACRGFPSKMLAERWRLDRARHAESSADTVLGVEFAGDDPPDHVVIRVHGPERSSIGARRGGLQVESRAGDDSWTLQNLGESFRAFEKQIPTPRILRFDATRLSAASYSNEEVPSLAIDGEGLAPVIADLAARSPDTLASIVAATREIVPSLVRVRAARAAVERVEQDHITVNERVVQVPRTQTYWGHRVVIDTLSGDEIPLSSAGEGTALALGLMTFLYTAREVGVLLLDDLDRALHPRAQQDLVRVVRGLLQGRSELQVIATTHSPFVLNELLYSEVRLTAMNARGETVVGSLVDHPEYARWKDHVAPGELWTSDLEDWLIGRATEAAE